MQSTSWKSWVDLNYVMHSSYINLLIYREFARISHTIKYSIQISGITVIAFQNSIYPEWNQTHTYTKAFLYYKTHNSPSIDHIFLLICILYIWPMGFIENDSEKYCFLHIPYNLHISHWHTVTIGTHLFREMNDWTCLEFCTSKILFVTMALYYTE